jgi:hypothetical protein
MRFVVRELCILLILLLPAGMGRAATLQSVAHVNLVQGGNALVVPPLASEDCFSSDESLPMVQTRYMARSVDHLRFALSGPPECRVNLRLSALESESRWSSRAGSAKIPLRSNVDSNHGADGLLWLNIPLDSLQRLGGDESVQPRGASFDPAGDRELDHSPLRLVLTVEYE